MYCRFPYILSRKEVREFKERFLDESEEFKEDLSNVEKVIFVDERRIKIIADNELYDLSIRDLPPGPRTRTILESLNGGGSK